MRQIYVIFEKVKDGYCAMFEELPTVSVFGETVEEAKVNAQSAIDNYITALEKRNRPVPEILQGGYELVFSSFALVKVPVPRHFLH